MLQGILRVLGLNQRSSLEVVDPLGDRFFSINKAADPRSSLSVSHIHWVNWLLQRAAFHQYSGETRSSEILSSIRVVSLSLVLLSYSSEHSRKVQVDILTR